MNHLHHLASPIATLLAVTARSWFRGTLAHQTQGCPQRSPQPRQWLDTGLGSAEKRVDVPS